jgi:hypothetical protein
MRAHIQPEIIYSFLYPVAAALEGLAEKPLDLAHKIEKHGNTSMNSIFIPELDGAI